MRGARVVGLIILMFGSLVFFCFLIGTSVGTPGSPITTHHIPGTLVGVFGSTAVGVGGLVAASVGLLIAGVTSIVIGQNDAIRSMYARARWEDEQLLRARSQQKDCR